MRTSPWVPQWVISTTPCLLLISRALQYNGADGSGYLIASSQRNNSNAVYYSTEPNEYPGNFRIIDKKGGIDGMKDTDEIDVTNLSMGELYPHGFFIARDGCNYEKGQKLPRTSK